MRPPKQKQPQVKKGLCQVLEHVDVDVDDGPRILESITITKSALSPQLLKDPEFGSGRDFDL